MADRDTFTQLFNDAPSGAPREDTTFSEAPTSYMTARYLEIPPTDFAEPTQTTLDTIIASLEEKMKSGAPRPRKLSATALVQRQDFDDRLDTTGEALQKPKAGVGHRPYPPDGEWVYGVFGGDGVFYPVGVMGHNNDDPCGTVRRLIEDRRLENAQPTGSS